MRDVMNVDCTHVNTHKMTSTSSKYLATVKCNYTRSSGSSRFRNSKHRLTDLSCYYNRIIYIYRAIDRFNFFPDSRRLQKRKRWIWKQKPIEIVLIVWDYIFRLLLYIDGRNTQICRRFTNRVFRFRILNFRSGHFNKNSTSVDFYFKCRFI